MNPLLYSTALACAASLALAGCVSSPNAGWRVEPVYRVDHAPAQAAAPGYLALARQYEGEGRWSLALRAYRHAALEAPADAEIHNALGLAEAGLGHSARAVAALRRAVALAPQRVQFVNNLGYALMLDGRVDEACFFLNLALALDPTHVRARQNLEQAQALLAPEPAPPAAEATAVSAAAEPQEQAQPLRVISAPDMPPLSVTSTPLEPIAAADAASQPTEPAPAPLPQARVEISNGNGVRGMAAWLAGWLREHGVEGRSRLTNLRPYISATTVVQYRAGFDAQAREIARRMPASVEVAADPRTGAASDVRIVLGHDLRELAACMAQGACTAQTAVASR